MRAKWGNWVSDKKKKKKKGPFTTRHVAQSEKSRNFSISFALPLARTLSPCNSRRIRPSSDGLRQIVPRPPSSLLRLLHLSLKRVSLPLSLSISYSHLSWTKHAASHNQWHWQRFGAHAPARRGQRKSKYGRLAPWSSRSRQPQQSTARVRIAVEPLRNVVYGHFWRWFKVPTSSFQPPHRIGTLRSQRKCSDWRHVFLCELMKLWQLIQTKQSHILR